MKKNTKKRKPNVVKEQIKVLVLLSLGLLIYASLQKHPFIKIPHLKTQTFAKLVPPTLSLNLHPTPSQTAPTFHPFLAIKQAEAEEKDKEYCLTVPIILYHHIEPISQAETEGHAQLTVDSTWFDAQMQYLKTNGYTTLSADELIEALVYGKVLPQKSILVTLDDGYVDAYTYAYPIAKAYNIQLNLMIPTGLIGKDDYMDWSMLEEMQESGIVHNYSHTVNHIALGGSAPDVIQREVADAKAALKEKLGIEDHIFTYPYGSYSDQAIQILEKNGYIAAFTTDPGRLQCRSSLMKLKRDHVGNLPLSSYGL